MKRLWTCLVFLSALAGTAHASWEVDHDEINRSAGCDAMDYLRVTVNDPDGSPTIQNEPWWTCRVSDGFGSPAVDCFTEILYVPIGIRVTTKWSVMAMGDCWWDFGEGGGSVSSPITWRSRPELAAYRAGCPHSGPLCDAGNTPSMAFDLIDAVCSVTDQDQVCIGSEVINEVDELNVSCVMDGEWACCSARRKWWGATYFLWSACCWVGDSGGSICVIHHPPKDFGGCDPGLPGCEGPV